MPMGVRVQTPATILRWTMHACLRNLTEVQPSVTNGDHPMSQREVKFKDKMFPLVGPQLKAGDAAPDFAVALMLDVFTLASTPKKARLFSVVPSLDTGVCSMQTKKFDDALAALKDKVASYTVSLDL